MSTIQQALEQAGLVKLNLINNSASFLGTKIEQDDSETTDLVLGQNHLGNKQYFLYGEEVCGRCSERYTNKILGVECDLCQLSSF